MNVGELELKVANAEEKVVKCKATIQRHENQLKKKLVALGKFGITLENMKSHKWNESSRGTDYYWAICEVEGKQDDIIGANKKLRDAESILAGWRQKLNVEVEKVRFLNEDAPQVIKDFLEEWKVKAKDWFIQAHLKYLELNDLLRAEKEEAKARFKELYPNKSTYSRDFDVHMKSEDEYQRTAQAIAMLGGAVVKMASYRHEEERLAWLDKMLEEDKKAKMLDLISRINAVVGTITDAQGLRINEKGNLDGIIVGDRAKAKIETISAGGYNIQCWHYRTLVHEVK